MSLVVRAPMLVAAFFLAASAAPVTAQSGSSGPSPSSEGAKASTGTTNLPAHQQHKEQQPQGATGPLDTTSGGAPADSPQGDTPAGMQAAPEGSSKTIKGDAK